jgi:hypothetical protein
VVYVERQARLVCELLQFHFPEAHAREPFEPRQSAVIVSSRYVGIAFSADELGPGTDRLHCELRRIALDPEVDLAPIS